MVTSIIKLPGVATSIIYNLIIFFTTRCVHTHAHTHNGLFSSKKTTKYFVVLTLKYNKKLDNVIGFEHYCKINNRALIRNAKYNVDVVLLMYFMFYHSCAVWSCTKENKESRRAAGDDNRTSRSARAKCFREQTAGYLRYHTNYFSGTPR